jgi:quercetin dioxygenase-like cupin family protein
MFLKKNDSGYQTPIDGIDQKTLVFGERTLMVEFRLKKDAVLPRHSHPHEQTGYLVSGKIRLHIDERSYECNPGDSWCIPGDANHGADVLEDAVAIEVFSPVREAYLPETE